MRYLDFIIQDASSFLRTEFNLQLEQSQLKIYSPENWQNFCNVNGFNANSEGLYVPISYSAYVRIDSPVLVSNVFHELFGHGLFCEHSQIGKRLVEIIQNREDEKSFLYNEVDPQKQPLGLCRRNIGNYEGFAVWLEALLCNETDTSNIFEQKKDRLPNDYISLFEYFQDVEQRLSRFGFMSQLGFPKFYDDSKVLDVVKRVYGSAFYNINFIIIYGSQKPESDIDLFVVSNNPSTNFFNGWLDIYEVNREDFHMLSNNLDISVTDPLFTGRLIYGDKSYFELLKQKIISQTITQEAIAHNLAEAEKQSEYLQYFSENDKRRGDCLSYIDSFSKNAEQLTQGNKPLTLANLKQIYLK
ncbi:MAG: nucleotidyltransferase domain-containing protein [Candidatus Aenigmatarchaeota archaeon]